MIGDGVRLAEISDNLLRFSQPVSGHGREQVVLDLVVKATIPEAGQGVGFDIAGSEHLLMQEVQWAVFVYNGHTFVVGSSDRTQVQAEQRLVNDNEQNHLPDVHARE